MYAPTAAGATVPRRVLASEKITSNSPSVAITSENRWASVARWLVEMLIAASANIAFAVIAPAMHPIDLHRDVRGRVAPAQAAESRVDQRDHRIEVPAGHRPEHEDDREQPGRSRRRVLEQLQPGVARRELLGGDPGADHHGCQERRAEELGDQAS